MGLTDFTIEAMGFRRMPPEKAVSAAFHSLTTFEIRGLKLDERESVESAASTVSDVPYRIALGPSPNRLARHLIDDDLVDDESRWLAESKSTPPFLMLHIGLPEIHEVRGAYVRDEPNRILTYGAFEYAKAKLKRAEGIVVPNIASAFTCEFSHFSPTVSLKQVSRDVYGITPDGRTLHDIRIEVRGSLSTAQRISPNTTQAYLSRSTDLAASLKSAVSQFLHLAFDEKDQLKRFLYLFFALERITHTTFASIDLDRHMSRLSEVSRRTSKPRDQPREWKTLQDRFAWCSVVVWTQLTDNDIATFRMLKKVRDRLAHGEITAPPSPSVQVIEDLVKKLLRQADPVTTHLQT